MEYARDQRRKVAEGLCGGGGGGLGGGGGGGGSVVVMVMDWMCWWSTRGFVVDLILVVDWGC